MRKIIIFLIFVSFFTSSFGKPSTNSSSKFVEKSTNISDEQIKLRKEITIDQFIAISYQLQYSSTPLSLSCALKALNIAKEINYKKAIAEAYCIIGEDYEIEREYLSAIKYSLMSYDLAKEIGNNRIQSQSLNHIGSIYHIINREDRSVRYYNLALSTAKKTNDTNQIINIFLNISDVYSDSNDYKTAGRILFYSLFLSLKQQNQIQEALLYKRLGIFYFQQSSFDKAVYYVEKSISLNNKINQQIQIGSIYTLLAHIYEKKKDFKLALAYNKTALMYRLSYNHDEQIPSSLLNIGKTFSMVGKLDSALSYLLIGTSKALVVRYKKNLILENGYKNLYDLYKKKNNNSEALKYFELYTIFNDSVKDENNKRLISIIETNHALTEKEKETAELRTENFIQRLEAKNRNLMMLLFLALSIIAIALIVYIQRLLIKNRKAKKIIEEINDQLMIEIKAQVIENEELIKREQEIRFLTDNTADMITLFDSNFKCLYSSPSSQVFLGYSPEELIDFQDFRDLIRSDSLKSFGIEFESMMEFHEATRFVYQIVKKNGTEFWVESNINPIFDSSTGKLKAMLSVTRDVTHQVDNEEAMMEASKAQEILIKEVHHRVKNNLSILTSLVNLQKDEFTDDKTLGVFSDMQFRVRAMALVHEQLYKSRNIEVLPILDYLTKLIGIVSSEYSNNRVHVHHDILDEIVSVEITLPCGLIVNELLTNAYKYAFPDSRQGNIWVTYKKAPHPTKANEKVRYLTVRDDGIGLPTDFNFGGRTSMGSQIITLLVKQIGAEIKIDKTTGASFCLILPFEK